MTRSFRTFLSVQPLAVRTFSFWNFGELLFSHWASWPLHSASPFAFAVTILQFQDRSSVVRAAQDSYPFEPTDFPILSLCPRNALQPATVSLTCPCWCFYFPLLRIGSFFPTEQPYFHTLQFALWSNWFLWSRNCSWWGVRFFTWVPCCTWGAFRLVIRVTCFFICRNWRLQCCL